MRFAGVISSGSCSATSPSPPSSRPDLSGAARASVHLRSSNAHGSRTSAACRRQTPSEASEPVGHHVDSNRIYRELPLERLSLGPGTTLADQADVLAEFEGTRSRCSLSTLRPRRGPAAQRLPLGVQLPRVRYSSTPARRAMRAPADLDIRLALWTTSERFDRSLAHARLRRAERKRSPRRACKSGLRPRH